MKVFLLAFAFCIFQVSFAQDGAGPSKLKNIQMRPLHKPETQNDPVILPVPVYAPVQQYPVQQYPPIQQIPLQQYPVHQYVPVQQIPVHYPQYQVQNYPQMPRPHSHHHAPQYYPQYYPQFPQGIPC